MRQSMKLGDLPRGATGVDQRTRLALTTIGYPTSARAGVTTGAVIGAMHVYPGLFTGMAMTSASATGVIECLARCYEANTQELQRRCAEGDVNALLAFLQEHPHALDERWLRALLGDAVVLALKTRNRAFFKGLQGLWRRWNPHRWEARVRVFGRVGTLIYQGAGSLYWIWELSEKVWGLAQRRSTRRRLFGLALPHVVANLLWLSSQWVKHQGNTLEAEIQHVGGRGAGPAGSHGRSTEDQAAPPESGVVGDRNGQRPIPAPRHEAPY
jgi:hypothetical protein